MRGAEVDKGIVCEILWWRLKTDLDGGVWDGRLYSPEPIVEQSGAIAVA
jgi:hypothetical protein